MAFERGYRIHRVGPIKVWVELSSTLFDTGAKNTGCQLGLGLH